MDNGVNQPVVGDAVTLWTRPRTDLILVFGHGVFDSVTHVTGRPAPVIKLDNNTEVVLHYTTVWCGRKADVAKVLARYQHEVNVVQWDLDKFLNGSLPDVDTLEPLGGGSPELGGKSLEGVPEPKTATDKVLLLGQRVALEEKRIAMLNAEIAKSQERIAGYEAQKLTLRDALLTEIARLFPGGIPAPSEAQHAPTPVTVAKVEPMPIPEVKTVPDDAFRKAAQRAAEED